MKGILRTRVGYCGGEVPNPTYRSIGDHTEGISVDYDPSVLSYDDLLQLFWQSHHLQSRAPSRQYLHAVFPRSAKQTQQAIASLNSQVKTLGIPPETVHTEIIPIEKFTLAEGYHHKYAIGSRDEIRGFLETTYPSIKAFADSSVAMRINGLMGGSSAADQERILADLDQFGLPPVLTERLRKGRKQ